MVEVAIPIWSMFAFGGTALIGLFALVGKLFVKQGDDKKTNTGKNISSCPGFNTSTYVTKEVCEQTRRTMHAEMKTISQAVRHTNETLERVERNQNEKLEQVIVLIKKNGN